MLEIKNLTKRFGGLVAVSDVSFKVDEGEIIGIIGPNGAGKTTLFNLITGYLKPDSGSILFQNEDVTGFKPHKMVKKGITRTFQIPRPFPKLTVYENVYAASIAAGKRPKNPNHETMRMLELIGLSQQKDQFAGGLSTGQLKFLEIARAFATKPDVLLLDEPFAGVRAKEMNHLASLIKRLQEQGMTLLLIEHLLKQLMRLVERVVVLHYGKKIAEGSPEEIAKDTKVIKAYLGDIKFA